MEQNLFRPRPAKYTKPVEEIHLAAVKNPQEELILVARQINALIRQGYRYREIAVVTGAVEAYQSYMDPVFTKYEIPYFMDTTKAVSYTHLICCVMRPRTRRIMENCIRQKCSGNTAWTVCGI